MKPMLSATYDPAKPIKFPAMVSPKLDGIRCLIIGGKAVSRNLKPIRNEYIQSILGDPSFNGLDGELVVGDPTDPMAYRNSSSGIMSTDGEPDFTFLVFDDFQDPNKPFYQRLFSAIDLTGGRIKAVPHSMIKTMEELEAFEAECLEAGYEGVMLRDPSGTYKFGRSTLKEGGLIKLKRFSDSEMKITAFEELMHNENELKRDELGRAERSSAQAGMIPGGTLGTLIGVDIHTGQGIRLGSGFTAADRDYIWGAKDSLTGKLVKYSYFAVGAYEKPRFPVFQGFRDINDL